MATISNTPRPGYVWDSTDNVWYPIGVGGHGHADYITQATAISPTTVDAKGDLLVGSAADTISRLAVGADGSSIVADSSTSTGLRYQSAYNGNAIINGGFDVWQRGTSFTAGSVYSADRWYLPAVSGTTTVSRDTDVPTGLAGQYSIKQLTAAGSSFAQWATPLESATVIPLQGKTVVLSWFMKVNATWSNNFAANIYYSNATDARASQITAVTFTAAVAQTPTTSWARFYGTFTVPTDAQGLLVQFNPSVAQASGAALWMAGVQLEIGSVPTTFKRAGGTIQGELAACQRYFTRYASTASFSPFSIGMTVGTGTVVFILPFKVRMRTNPTFVFSAGNTFAAYTSAGGVIAGTSMILDRTGDDAGMLALNVASGLTNGQACGVITNSSAAPTIDASAEL